MMKCTVLKPFMDLVENTPREIGEEFSAKDERAKYLEGLYLVKAESEAEPKKKPRKKK